MSDQKPYRRRFNRWLVLPFVLAVLLTVFFGVRMVLFSMHWSDPGARDQVIEGWMTPRYVGHSWHVPPEVIGEALAIDPEEPRRRITLSELAEERGVTVEELAAMLETAILAFRETTP